MRAHALSWRLAFVLPLCVGGCTLDIDRLYGDAGGAMDAGMDAAMDDAPSADAPPTTDVPSDSATDAPRFVGDAGAGELAIRAEYEVSTMGLPTSVAAATGLGTTRVAVAVATDGAAHLLRVLGSGCTLGLELDRVYSGGYTGPVAVGQVNADGLPDVVIARSGPAVVMGDLAAVMGNALAVPISSPSHALGALAAIDLGAFDRDGRADVLAVEEGGARALLLFGLTTEGMFAGTLGPSGTAPAYEDGAFVEHDADGDSDFALLERDAGVRALRYLGAGDRSYASTPVEVDVGAASIRFTHGALDGGPSHLFVVGGDTLYVISRTGLVDTQTLEAAARDVVVAELDGAFPRELVISSPSDRSLLVYHWSTTEFGRVSRITLASAPTELAVADADGDGRDELLGLFGQHLALMSTAVCP